MAHLSQLELKVDAIAEWAGVPIHQRRELESTLAVLPWPGRRRLKLVLEGIQTQARMDDNPSLAAAAAFVLRLAHEVWTDPPRSAA